MERRGLLLRRQSSVASSLGVDTRTPDWPDVGIGEDTKLADRMVVMESPLYDSVFTR